MVKQKKLKSILLLTLTLLMLAIMAIFPLVRNASAVETVNYFDMTAFETDNLRFKTEHVKVLGVNEYNFAYNFDNGKTDRVHIQSGYFYLPAGEYTLSAIYQSTYESETVDCWLVQKDGTEEDLCSLSWSDGMQNVLRSNTFTASINGFYYLKIFHTADIEGSGTYMASFSEIMINKGDEPMPFVPYIKVNDEIQAINNQTDNILAKLDDLFGTNSGLIAGASLGTVILLLFFLYLFLRRR